MSCKDLCPQECVRELVHFNMCLGVCRYLRNVVKFLYLLFIFQMLFPSSQYSPNEQVDHRSLESPYQHVLVITLCCFRNLHFSEAQNCY